MKPHDTLFRTLIAHRDLQQDLLKVALPELAEHIRMETVSTESLQNVAHTMLRKGLPVALIVETIGLTPEEIQTPLRRGPNSMRSLRTTRFVKRTTRFV